MGEVVKAISERIAPFSDPMLSELGLYVAGKIRFIRFKNSIRVLQKAKQILEDQGMEPQPVNLKILVPILENAGLEDENELVDQWARLLASASAGQTVTPAFPTILSQLTPLDAQVLESLWRALQSSSVAVSEGQQYQPITADDLRKTHGLSESDFHLLADNLLRLRLILIGGLVIDDMGDEPVPIRGYQQIALSELGIRFMNACHGP